MASAVRNQLQKMALDTRTTASQPAAPSPPEAKAEASMVEKTTLNAVASKH